MSIDFEELDYQETELGGLSLRRRGILSLGGMEVYEIQLGDAFLMSSLFTEVEVALADLGLAELDGGALDVVVGGLGLGYTAHAALRNPAVKSLLVIEFLPPRDRLAPPRPGSSRSAIDRRSALPIHAW